MRLLIWNIAYGTGCARSYPGHIAALRNYVLTPKRHIENIIESIESVNPDLIGLVEVDVGSFRTRFRNQVNQIAEHLGHHWFSHSKYQSPILTRRAPILRKQANAVISRIAYVKKRIHYLPVGMKRVVIEVDYGAFRFFVAHLALDRATRAVQIAALAELLPQDKPLILCGDFNTFDGVGELLPLKMALQLRSLNEFNAPTFPAWAPNHELDFILVSHDITGSAYVPEFLFSDHRPLVADLDIPGAELVFDA